MQKRIAWLLLIVLGAAWWLPWWGIALLLLLAVSEPLYRAFRRARTRERRRGTGAVTVRGSMEPPDPSRAYKPPTTVRALIAAVEATDTGTVTPRADGARVQLKSGGWAAFTAALPERVTQSTLALEGSSVAAVAMLCDALTRELGALRLDVEGVRLTIDGTRPQALLLRDVIEALDAHGRKADLRPASPDTGYLH